MQSKFKILGNNSKTAFKSRNLADFLFYKLEQQMRYVKVSEKSTKPAKEILKNGTSLAVCARNKKRKQTQNESLDGSEDGGDGSPIVPNDLVYPGEQEEDAEDLLEFDAVIEQEDDDENNDDDEDKENNASEI